MSEVGCEWNGRVEARLVSSCYFVEGSNFRIGAY